MANIPSSVRADPTKAFFVKMLTRDISLDDCILDLIDNSIDGAWHHAGIDPSDLIIDDAMSKYSIHISFNEEKFVIGDNCGGISLNQAATYAFTFGRDDDRSNDPAFSVGVYGIGMKRAIFKIGNNIRVTSTHYEAENPESFVVPIDVPLWMQEKTHPWDFDLEPTEDLPEAGVKIEVKALNDDTVARFRDPTYEKSLIRVLQRDYMIPLMRGLRLSVNGKSITGWKPSFRESEAFATMRHSYGEGEVKVEIIAGMFELPPEDAGPEEATQRRTPQDNPSGWYVICNGRVVLAADTTRLTVWGKSGTPKWHRQYSGFVGFAIFSSTNPVLLPMTTTKRNIDESSSILRRALTRMSEPTRQWIDYTNSRKNNPDAAKVFEKTLKAVAINEISKRETFVMPAVARPAGRVQMANVAYSVPLTELRKLADAFGDITLPYTAVGARAFDYAFSDLVDE